MLTLLAGSTNALAATEPWRLAPPGPQLPKGLPLAQRVAGGIMLPGASAHGLHVYVVEWEHYPEQAQAAMDAMADVYETELAEQHRLDTATAQESSDKRSANAEAHRLTLPKVGLIAGVAAAITFGLVEYFEHKH
jgi:hypothetical protein